MPTVIDLRRPEERERAPLPGSVALTLEEIEDGAHGLRPEQGPFTVICTLGTRADLAARYLRADGLDARRGSPD
ncbi:hypothetical protein SAMN04488058_10531 [Deinococcus reticulitermitis]|uniref:Rhodanese domain-containing protein n=1 Tax=Deinococcus reticulitermitis TaxID=856736 RepID=A0A1H6X6W2_9DEIO|nr:rhodanese-like domain-containing protein [Deinococcus reticulitermitis]SEJ22337.1 hypothetical protein SAMN04488058_10531 [Deinococcus reticulitermitis]